MLWFGTLECAPILCQEKFFNFRSVDEAHLYRTRQGLILNRKVPIVPELKISNDWVKGVGR